MKGGPRVRRRSGNRKKPIITLADALSLRDERNAIRQRIRELEPRLDLLNRKIAGIKLLMEWKAEKGANATLP